MNWWRREKNIECRATSSRYGLGCSSMGRRMVSPNERVL